MNRRLEKLLGILQNKLGEIQSSDETIKKRWLIVFSAISMALIVALWITYMNFTVLSLDVREVPQDASAIDEKEFAELASNALYNARNLLSSLFAKVSSPHQIEIKKEEFNFIPD